MAKKQMKNLGRRGLSLFLSLVMVLSLMQLPAFAASFKDQVMDSYYQLNENNQIIGTTTEAAHTEHGFTLEKTIEQTGVNAFDITLKVVTSQTVTTRDAAIQLVIDTSNSMKYCAECGSSSYCWCDAGTRMQAVKNAVAGKGGFLDSLIENNTSGGKIYVSVVYFGSTAHTKCEWIDITTTKGLSDVKKAVNGLSPNGGTNLEAGLMLARNRLGMDEIASAANKFTVLLSDGEPTYYAPKDSDDTDDITSNNSDGSGSSASSTEIAQTKDMAAEVRELSKLYTICYGVGDDTLYNTELCQHCDKVQSEHEKVTSGSRWNRKTTYYCLDENGQQLETTFKGEKETVTIGEYLEDEIATAKDGEVVYAFDAKDTETLEASFANVALSSAAGMNGGGTTVTDPMGEFIVLGNVSKLEDDGLTASGGTITWALDPANAQKETEGNVTTYTYEVTYPITLNTSAAGFRETNDDESIKYYPTNEYTYLSVVIDDEPVKIPFNIPAVNGELPEIEWTVEYYLQEDAAAGDYDEYELEDSDDFGPVELWTSVSAPDGFRTKYVGRDYTFVDGETTLQITPDGENVMKLYYDYITAPVIVNHFYKTDVIDPDGNEVPGAYPAEPQQSSDEDVKINTSYTAIPDETLGTVEYDLVDADPKDRKITVEKDGENVINLYYSREVDQRFPAEIRIKHIYNTYGYELQDGKYVRVKQNSQEMIVTDTTALPGVRYGVDPAARIQGFQLNEDEGDYEELLQDDDTLSFLVSKDSSKNEFTLVYEKEIDARQAIEVTVNHYYTKSVTSVVDGKVVTTVDPEKELGESERFDAYVGESFTAKEIKKYLGETYQADPSNADKLYVASLAGDKVIDLYYDRTEVPEPVSITINHYWRTFTEVTVEDIVYQIDPDTQIGEYVVVGTSIVNEVDEDHSIENVKVDGLYENQEYTAAKESWGEGYKFNAKESNQTIIVGDEWVIDMYYDRQAEDDVRRDAEIDVIHNYTTNLTTVIDGQVDTIPVNDGSELESFDQVKAGDEFTAEPKVEYKGNVYTQVTDGEKLTATIQPGTNATIVIDYVRDDSDLVDTVYTVNYEYRTYTMTVNQSGVAGYWNAPAVESDSTGGAGYVDQRVVLEAGGREGFAPLATNPATVQILKADNNVWTFVYEQYIPLAPGSVTVNHYYKTTTIGIDGRSLVSNSSSLGNPVVKYLGESYDAQAQLNGFQLVNSKLDGVDAAVEAVIPVIVTGDNVVDFYYEKTIDNSVLADYTIRHVYNLYDWDNELISSSEADAVTGRGFVTTQITAIPDAGNYELVDVTYNGDDLAAPYTIYLQDGENEILFVYEKKLARDLLSVKVIHNYYQDEAAVAEASPISTYEMTVSEILEESSYTADKRNVEGYKFYSADPEDRTITVTEDGENQIVLNYIRQTAGYKVIHEYYANEDLEATDGENEIVDGFVGDVIEADSITRVTSRDGKEYQFIEATEDITLAADETEIIILTYKRTVYTPPTDESDEDEPKKPNKPSKPSKPDPKPEEPVETPEEPVVEIPEEEVPLVEEPAIEIPEEDVPLAELPELDIFDEEVPLALLPETGDPLALYAAVSALSGLGLIVLNKKKDDEEA